MNILINILMVVAGLCVALLLVAALSYAWTKGRLWCLNRNFRKIK